MISLTKTSAGVSRSRLCVGACSVFGQSRWASPRRLAPSPCPDRNSAFFHAYGVSRYFAR